MQSRIRRGVAGAILALSMAVGVSIASASAASASAAQATEQHFILAGSASPEALRAWVADYEQQYGVDCTISNLQEVVVPPWEEPGYPPQPGTTFWRADVHCV